MCLEVRGFITAFYPQIYIWLFLPPDHNSSALSTNIFQKYATGIICQEEKKTQFWLCLCSAREERQSPFLSVRTELCWDIWSNLLYQLPELLSQGWESKNMRNFTPTSAGLRTRRTEPSEGRLPRGSQLRSISAVKALLSLSPQPWLLDVQLELSPCELHRQGWTDSPFHSSHPRISDHLFG